MALIFRRAVFDQDVLARDEACFLQALAEGGHEVLGVSERGVPQKTNNRHRRLLRARNQGPRGRAAKHRDELASFEVEHGLFPGTDWASLPHAKVAVEVPTCPWAGPESF